jgi:ATP-binding protein involved in chromosome partitioning
MPLNIRTYHDLAEPDRSGLPQQIARQRRLVAERLAGVGRLVAVMSGKGGVGKSFVTAHLARALARAGNQVGVLDADLNGPTIPRLLQTHHSPLTTHESGVEPVAGLDGVRCMSMGLLVEDGRPLAFRGPEQESFVWRGALEASTTRELLSGVRWGTLDLLLVDLPPGVQRHAELADLLPEPPAVLTVTIPTPESRDAVRRALRAAADRGSPLLGVVENMAGDPFSGDAGEALAREFDIPLLARIPFHPAAETWDDLASHSAIRNPHSAL